VVPLARLTAGAGGALVGAEDLAAFTSLLEKLGQTHAVFDQLPWPFVDACRWGTQNCVGPGGAVGALLDLDGNIRPCTHGGAIARSDDTYQTVSSRYLQLGDELMARRGCRACEARPVCSRCLFPAVLDEAAYCSFVRQHATQLGLLRRLHYTLGKLGGIGHPVELERWPRERSSSPEPAWPPLTRLWNERDCWLLRDGERWSFWRSDMGWVVDAPLGWLGRLVGDGVDRATIEAQCRGSGVPPTRLDLLVRRVAGLLGADPAVVMARTVD
jgi:radical SAM protein with 4Fe4S-binding SPASM domain